MLISQFKLEPVANQLKLISLWGLLLSSLIGCQAPQIAIKEISEQKIGKTVYLTGKVIHLAPLLDNTAYQIDDLTGKTWIITSQTPPKLNQQISIKGKIKYQSLPFAEQELGDFYLVELERLKSVINDSKQPVE